MVAGRAERLVEGDRLVLADGQVDRLLGADPAVDHQADPDAVGLVGPKLRIVGATSTGRRR